MERIENMMESVWDENWQGDEVRAMGQSYGGSARDMWGGDGRKGKWDREVKRRQEGVVKG